MKILIVVGIIGAVVAVLDAVSIVVAITKARAEQEKEDG